MYFYLKCSGKPQNSHKGTVGLWADNRARFLLITKQETDNDVPDIRMICEFLLQRVFHCSSSDTLQQHKVGTLNHVNYVISCNIYDPAQLRQRVSVSDDPSSPASVAYNTDVSLGPATATGVQTNKKWLSSDSNASPLSNAGCVVCPRINQRKFRYPYHTTP
jgi:hypothetical protein